MGLVLVLRLLVVLGLLLALLLRLRGLLATTVSPATRLHYPPFAMRLVLVVTPPATRVVRPMLLGLLLPLLLALLPLLLPLLLLGCRGLLPPALVLLLLLVSIPAHRRVPAALLRALRGRGPSVPLVLVPRSLLLVIPRGIVAPLLRLRLCVATVPAVSCSCALPPRALAPVPVPLIPLHVVLAGWPVSVLIMPHLAHPTVTLVSLLAPLPIALGVLLSAVVPLRVRRRGFATPPGRGSRGGTLLPLPPPRVCLLLLLLRVVVPLRLMRPLPRIHPPRRLICCSGCGTGGRRRHRRGWHPLWGRGRGSRGGPRRLGLGLVGLGGGLIRGGVVRVVGGGLGVSGVGNGRRRGGILGGILLGFLFDGVEEALGEAAEVEGEWQLRGGFWYV